MPLLDLSLATQTLLNLVERRVKTGLTALGQPAAVINGLTVSALPADRLTGDQTVGLYLYHAVEDAAAKNLPPISQDQPAVQFRPLGLRLFYQLTAHSDVAGEPGAMRTQLLFGLALKALHDFPSIDDSTLVNGTPVFPPALQGTDNRVRVVLQVIQPSEASQFWTAGNQPMRLAAYYEVSIVLLEPEPPGRFAGRVLQYGVHTFTRGGPRLDGSRSTVIFRVPGDTDDREAEVQPGEAPVGGQLTFFGTDLAGDDTTLLLKNPRFPQPVEVGATWGLVARGDQIAATIAPLIGAFDTLPGLYSAIAKVTTRKRMPDGSIRNFANTSNEVPFLVSPTITNPAYNVVATANAQGIVIVTGGTFQHADIGPDDVKLVVGPESVPLETTASLTPGHFRISSATQLRFRFPIPGLTSGQIVPFRILVNGAENAPRWVTVP